MKQLTTAALAFLLLVACGGTGSSPQPAASSGPPEKTSLKMGVGGQSQIIYLPATLADQLGYYRDEGVSVEIDDLKGGSDALKALLGGSVDIVTGFYEHTIRTQTQGKFIETVALFDQYPGLVMMVGKQHADQVRSIKDLAGHPVGVTSPGSSTDEMVKFLEKKNGMAADAIPVVAIGSGSTAIAAITSGQVWAGVTVEPAVSQMEKAGTAKALYDTRTPQGTKAVFGGTWPAGGFYVPTDFVRENPRTVQAMVRAGVRALRYLKTHSAADIADHLPASFYGGDKAAFVETLRANLTMFSDTGLMPSDGPGIVFDTVKTADPKTDWSTVELKRTYDNSFVQKAAVT
ncbi:MAG TPA: ABC transporter substrate-binding protein [Candidatus Dormibacteraeota bacterium]|nr:ABC transporter substrate-binding protein [Candidatus Dormibacteraeota bacterium]